MSDMQDKLVHMANQIASNFKHVPQAEGVATLTNHINKFWDPRMRRGLLAAAQAGGAGFDPLLSAAIKDIKPPK